jgi:coenzyme F420 hydrogenase subunit beta
MLQAMGDGWINKAVVTKAVANFPLPMTADDRQGILEARRSKFAMAPANKEVNRSAAIPSNQVGVVGLPCQATGSRKRQLMPREDGIPEGSIVLNIGLFCTWALSQQGWRCLLRKYVGDETVQRIDIPPPPANVMEIRVGEKKRVLSLDEVRNFIRPACQVCLDMTAENTDLSVGMVEGWEGYNTIIVRTELGRSLLSRAVESGAIQIESLDGERWKHLNEASLNKKKRAISEAEKRGDSLPYYRRMLSLKEKIWRGKANP